MMRIRYVVHRQDQSSGLVTIKFSTGMEIAATTEEADRIADALDAVVLGANREIRGKRNWSLKMEPVARVVRLELRAATISRTVGLLPQVANSLAYELRGSSAVV